jgi:YfiH family protein
MADRFEPLEVVQINDWKRYRWLRHGFSTRYGGVSTAYGGNTLNLGWTNEDDSRLVAENRRRFVNAVAEDSNDGDLALIYLRQIHSATIHRITDQAGALSTPEGKAVLEGDGLMTDLPGLLLGVGTADCVPVLVIDVKRRIVAAFHAGWRGTIAGIVQKGIAKMRVEYESQPEDLVAAVGPSIGPCCYSVGGEMQTEFVSKFPYADELFRKKSQSEAFKTTRSEDRTYSSPTGHSEARNAETKIYLDLWEANRKQLVDTGLKEAQITVIGECTACARNADGTMRYFSHRAERGVAGRMLSVAGVVR